MAGLLDWVDPAREWWQTRPQALSGLLGAAYQLATDPAARESAMARHPVQFDRSASGQQMMDNALNFNPSGLLGMTKGALPKLAKAAEKAEFDTGKPASAIGFHGSPSPDVSFDLSKPAFLSSRADVANDYTAARGMWTSVPKEGATVYPANVEFKNPLVIDAMGTRHDNVPNPWVQWEPKVFGRLPKKSLSVSDLAEIAKAQGHDGLIVKNVIDTADIDGKKKSTVYAALMPGTIADFFRR